MSEIVPAETRAIVDTLIAAWLELADVTSGLTEAQWKSPSGLPGWSVQDVLSHVVGTERMLQGLPLAGDPSDVADVPHVRNPIGAFNEVQVAARRGRSGADVLTEWNELRELREDTLRAGDADYFATPMVTPTGPGTLADFLSVRILDCWSHGQDIRDATGQSGGFDGPAANHTIDRLIRTIPIVVGKRAACPEGAAVRVIIIGAVERDLVCEVSGGRAGFVHAPAAPPVVTIALDAQGFVRLANGRRTADEIDTITIVGDTDLGRRVVDNFTMMI